MTVYFVQRANGDIKIGTTEDVRARLSCLTVEYGKLELLALTEGDRDVERQFHIQFRDSWTGKGEWFRSTPELQGVIQQHSQFTIPAPALTRLNIMVTPTINRTLRQYAETNNLTLSEALQQIVEWYFSTVYKQ